MREQDVVNGAEKDRCEPGQLLQPTQVCTKLRGERAVQRAASQGGWEQVEQ